MPFTNKLNLYKVALIVKEWKLKSINHSHSPVIILLCFYSYTETNGNKMVQLNRFLMFGTQHNDLQTVLLRT